jgi:IMP cyclohydrolase
MERITVRMEYLKSTKNTHRYEAAEDEKDATTGRAAVDSIYVRQSDVGPNAPQFITVTVSPDSS